MIDLTNTIALSNSRKNNWGKEKALSLLKQFARKIPGLTIDFDVESGEMWLRLLRGKMVVAIIHRELPLIIFSDNELALPLQDLDLIMIQSDDFDSSTFSIEEGILSQAFELKQVSPAIDVNSFSVNDLWYVTAT